MANRYALVFTGVLSLLTVGCESGVTGVDGPTGAVQPSEILAAFAGDWQIDFSRTMSAWKRAGVPDAQIDQTVQIFKQNPEFGKLHPDMTIDGNVAVMKNGPLESEYRFFSMHRHDGKVCGKAWHHEDRPDPGDMSKCYVRLKLENGNLLMEVKMQDGLPDLSDPELNGSVAAEGGSAADCDAENPAGDGWSDWTTYVFTRKTAPPSST